MPIRYTVTVSARSDKNSYTFDIPLGTWQGVRQDDETKRSILESMRKGAEKTWPQYKGHIKIRIEDFTVQDAFDALRETREFLQSLGYTGGDIVENLERAEKRLYDEIKLAKGSK